MNKHEKNRSILKEFTGNSPEEKINDPHGYTGSPLQRLT
jgi:hypothetical protein